MSLFFLQVPEMLVKWFYYVYNKPTTIATHYNGLHFLRH